MSKPVDMSDAKVRLEILHRLLRAAGVHIGWTDRNVPLISVRGSRVVTHVEEAESLIVAARPVKGGTQVEQFQRAVGIEPADDRDPWGSDDTYPRADWEYEVGNGDTNLGYWEWVDNQREMAEL